MQNTVRTTIRIRKDLLDQSKAIAHSKNTTLQDVINDTLAVGFKHVTDLNSSKEAMSQIDRFRKKLDSKQIDLKRLLDTNKRNLK